MTYTAPKPKTISEDLLRELIQLSKSPAIAPFTAHRLKRDAATLMKKDASGGHMILGILACLLWDFPEMKRQHRLAVKCASGDEKISALTNYAISLNNVGLYDDCVSEMEPAYRKYPGNIGILNQLITANITRGAIKEALVNWNEINRLKKSSDFCYDKALFENVLSFLKSHNISENQFMDFLSTAADFCIDNRVRSVFSQLRIQEDEEDGEKFLAVVFVIMSTPKSCAKLNLRFANKVIEKSFIDPIIQRVPVVFLAA